MAHRTPIAAVLRPSIAPSPRPPIDFDALRIATPCTASWDLMTGDARRRFCGQCRLHVYDVSELTRGEAETLLRKGEGRVCMRLHRRADGRIVTKDCGRVRAAIERRIRWVRAAAASVMALLGFAGCSRDDRAPEPRAPGTVATPPERPLMGDVCAPPLRPTMGEAVVPAPPDPTMGRTVAPVPSAPGMEMGNISEEKLGSLSGKR